MNISQKNFDAIMIVSDLLLILTTTLTNLATADSKTDAEIANLINQVESHSATNVEKLKALLNQ